MKKNRFDKVVCIIITLIMLFIPLFKLCSYIPEAELFLNNFGFHRVYILWGSIFFLIIIYLFGLFSGENKISYVDVIVYILIILAFISTNHAIDFKKAFFGETYRYEGLLTILSYYLLLLNAKGLNNNKYKMFIVKTFIVIGIFQVLYCILQSYTDFEFINRYNISYMAMGFCSNPNFFGSYMTMQLLIVGFMYIYTRRKIYLFLYVLFVLSLYSAESTGPVLSVVCTLIFSLILFRNKFKDILKITLLLFVVFVCTDKLLNYVQNTFYKQELVEYYDIPSDVVTIVKEPSSQIASGRLVVWQRSLPLVKKYWLFGCGLDNFKDAYPQEGSLKYDKAHNVYLQILITNGLFALIFFLLLLFMAFLRGVKKKNVILTPIYVAFIGYSIQAFFNISVIDVAPYYYIILGLIFSDYSDLKACLVSD